MDREDLARLKKQNYTLRLEYRVGITPASGHNFEATLNIINSWDSESFDLLLIERDVQNASIQRTS
jgi:hypothetical protein